MEPRVDVLLEALNLLAVLFFALALLLELALADGVEKEDLVLFECAELVRESVALLPFVLLRCLVEKVSHEGNGS